MRSVKILSRLNNPAAPSLLSPTLNPATSILSRSIHSDTNNISPIKRKNIILPLAFVPQNSTTLHERFGQKIGERDPGLSYFIPFIESTVNVSKAEHVYAVTTQEAITSDNASVRADGVFYYKVIDTTKAAYEINNLPRAIENLVVTNLRAVMGGMTLDELLGGRKAINNKLETVIGPATKNWGVEVTRIEIRDIKPEQKLVEAMDKQMTAERERREMVTKATAEKESAIHKAQGDFEATKLHAEAALVAARSKLKPEL